MRDFMGNKSIEVSVSINAPLSKVWQALIDPKMVKQYLFGTQLSTDWKVGSDIKWSGEWEGKKYEDKGRVIRVEKERLLEYTYFSGMSNLADVPENYKKITCKLSFNNGKTTLTIIQTNNSPQALDHSEDNWKIVSDAIKKLVEQK